MRRSTLVTVFAAAVIAAAVITAGGCSGCSTVHALFVDEGEASWAATNAAPANLSETP